MTAGPPIRKSSYIQRSSSVIWLSALPPRSANSAIFSAIT
jgi:hypothetical protein